MPQRRTSIIVAAIMIGVVGLVVWRIARGDLHEWFGKNDPGTSSQLSGNIEAQAGAANRQPQTSTICSCLAPAGALVSAYSSAASRGIFFDMPRCPC